MAISPKQQQLAQEALKSLPILPLPGGILFPYTLMPLYIFEERYCKMIKDILQSEHRMMAMVHCDQNENISKVAGIGQILQAAPQADGRYHILLQGWTRIYIDKELEDENFEYRRICGRLYLQEATNNSDTKNLEIQRKKNTLIQICMQVCKHNPMLNQVLSPLLNSSLELAPLLDLLAATMLQKHEERQQCLEADSLLQRMGLVNQAISEHLLLSLQHNTHNNEVC